VAGEEGARRYRAFITYSHRDKRWANWLHRRLEFYRVPRRLIGRETSAGVITRRLTPVFRDREELATADDLGEKISQALENSDTLIVICSPSSARSKWVNEEILRFKRSGRGDHILCLIVDGEPLAAVNGGDDSNECFPPALCSRNGDSGHGRGGLIEPLAADVRPGGDGRGLALMKIIAGLLAVGLDELRRRELQRRNRRWAAVAGLALVVMAATSLLALEATHQRNVAEHRRAQAESLVAFMLGNLRTELQPIGRLDLLDMIGKRALAYYSKQNLNTLDADSLERRAKALRLIGEVDSTRGNLDAALKVFHQAADTTSRLLSLEPDNPQRIYDHAQSMFWVGNIAWQRGNLQSAETAFKRYRSLAEQLVRIGPDNPDWQEQLYEADMDLGILLLHENKVEEARDKFLKSLPIASKLADAFTHDDQKQLNLAQVRSYVADSEEQLGHLDSAYRQRSMELHVYQQVLSRDPGNSFARSSLVACKRALARIEVSKGDTQAALPLLKSAIAVADDLVRQDHSNAFWQGLSANAYADLGQLNYELGDFDSAASAVTRAEGIAHGLIKKNSSAILAHCQLLKARIAASRNQYGDELAMATQAVTGLSALPAKMQADPNIQTLLIEARLLQGEGLHALGRNGSISSWKAGLDVVKTHPGNRAPAMRTLLALTYFRLGKKKQARRIMLQLDTVGYRTPEFMRLKSLVSGKPEEQISANSSHQGFNRMP